MKKSIDFLGCTCTVSYTALDLPYLTSLCAHKECGTSDAHLTVPYEFFLAPAPIRSATIVENALFVGAACPCEKTEKRPFRTSQEQPLPVVTDGTGARW